MVLLEYLKKSYKLILIFSIIGFIFIFMMRWQFETKNLDLKNLLITITGTIIVSLFLSICSFIITTLSPKHLHNFYKPLDDFVDRNVELCQIIQLLSDNKNINLYGENGIGKSYLVKELLAILNKSDNLKGKYAKIPTIKNCFAFYFDGKSRKTYISQLEEAINNSLMGSKISGISEVHNLFKRTKLQQFVFIFVEIKQSASDIEKIEEFSHHFKNEIYSFIIVSESSVISSSILSFDFSLSGKTFTDLEIKEMIPGLNDEDRQQILKISEGIPLLIDIVKKNSTPSTSFSNSNSRNEYFNYILSDISSENQEAFFTLIKLTVDLLIDNKTTVRHNMKENSLRLLTAKSLINYDVKSRTVSIYNLIEEILHETLLKWNPQKYQDELEMAFIENLSIDTSKGHL